jgi:hypothetical protein
MVFEGSHLMVFTNPTVSKNNNRELLLSNLNYRRYRFFMLHLTFILFKILISIYKSIGHILNFFSDKSNQIITKYMIFFKNK